ncbi:MAG: YggS family pyridoxal phosphate-dependent enzyme [Oscillospiraceae bacterium]
MEKSFEEIKARVEAVQERIQAACIKAGRSRDEVTLVGVTKAQSVQEVRHLLNAGITTIGENRVQELLEKEPGLADITHTMHLIGGLQRNKAKYLPGHIDMLQSLDNEKTLEALEKAFGASGKTLDVLIEVNIGDESSKNGIDPGELEALADRVNASSVLKLRGLMAIPPQCEGEEVRAYFGKMYQLFVDIRRKKSDNNTINTLSMGMSHDFEFAILEGATMVRVGTDLFGPRVYV